MSRPPPDIGETSIVSRTGGATTFAMGMANFLKSYLGGHDSMAFWYHFAIMFEALFILTTVDNGTRVARYQIGEMLGNVRKLKKFADPTWKPGNIITTLIATALWGGLLWMGVSDANGGINAMVPIFGISNQLLAAACFVLITVCVAKMGYWKHLWIPVVPLVWDIAVTFTADFQKIFGPLSYFTTASKYQAQIDSGELTGEALANAKAALSNAYLDGVLSVFFLVMMGVFVVVGIVVVARTFAAGKYGAETRPRSRSWNPSGSRPPAWSPPRLRRRCSANTAPSCMSLCGTGMLQRSASLAPLFSRGANNQRKETNDSATRLPYWPRRSSGICA